MSFRRQLGDVIFETDTPLARAFDVALLWAILLSVLLVVLESVASIGFRYGTELRILEWIFTGLFTVEYVLRVYSASDRRSYLTSFYGIIDLLAVLPTYLSLAFIGTQYFIVLRSLRLLRIFRVFKLSRYLSEASILAQAMRASREKIIVFLMTVLTLILIIGSVMYLVEGPEHGFDNIPVSIYWAIVTLTTVGYGDISPQTPLGQFLSGVVMLTGYAIIAVPTGIITTEIARAANPGHHDQRTCPNCGLKGHDVDARYCRYCGEELEPSSSSR